MTELNIETLEKQAWNLLRTCYDPEIPVNLVELGLIYEVKIIDEPQRIIKVKMTLTSPGCSMADWIISEIRNKLITVPSIKQVEIELVFDPPWSLERISEAAKLELGIG